jgi:DNA-binding transcriptional ArsR family regulator
MASNGLFAEVAALAGDPGRASMLHALMDGRALTATELTKVAGITPQTASGHLNRMIHRSACRFYMSAWHGAQRAECSMDRVFHFFPRHRRGI